MLVLSRKPGEKIRIGESVVTIIRVGNGIVSVGIEAPRHIPVVRTELDGRRNGGDQAAH